MPSSPETPSTQNPENVRKTRRTLTEFERGLISGLSRAGAKVSKIVDVTGFTRGQVKYTLKTEDQRIDGKNMSKSGEHLSYSKRAQSIMMRHVRKHPQYTNEQHRQGTGIEMSDSTIKRLVKKEGLKKAKRCARVVE